MDDQGASHRHGRVRRTVIVRGLHEAVKLDCGLRTAEKLRTAESVNPHSGVRSLSAVRSPQLYLSASLKLTPALNPGSLRAFTITVRPVNTLFTSRALCD